LPLLLMALGVPILWFLLERAGGDMAQVPACLGSIALALLVACTWAAWTPKKKTP
jgi:hypothetical protein